MRGNTTNPETDNTLNNSGFLRKQIPISDRTTGEKHPKVAQPIVNQPGFQSVRLGSERTDGGGSVTPHDSSSF